MTIKGRAPCGHIGTYVTNTFIACDQRCEFPKEKSAATPMPPDDELDESDGIPVYIDPERTLPLCPFCRSDEVEQYQGFVTTQGQLVWHCDNCQQSFSA